MSRLAELGEEPLCVFGRPLLDPFEGQLGMNLGELLGHLCDEGRFIALAPGRQRGKLGTVGLDQHAIQRRLLGNLAEHPRIGERENARKGQIEPQVQRILRQPGIP